MYWSSLGFQHFLHLENTALTCHCFSFWKIFLVLLGRSACYNLFFSLRILHGQLVPELANCGLWLGTNILFWENTYSCFYVLTTCTYSASGYSNGKQQSGFRILINWEVRVKLDFFYFIFYSCWVGKMHVWKLELFLF